MAKVGGYTPEVLGAPTVIKEGSASAVVFNGRSDGLILAHNPLAGWSRFTIEVLFKPDPAGEPEQRFLHIEDAQGRRATVETRLTSDHQWVLDTYLRATPTHNRTLIDRAKTHATNQWYWVALVYDGKVMASYVDGEKELDGAIDLPVMAEGATSIGVRQNKVSWYKGAIREVRFSPSALSPESLQRIKR